jgi:glutamate--cysteine ligase
MSDVPTLVRNDLVRVFEPRSGAVELVGLELEYGLVDPQTGRSVGYAEPAGSRAVLEAVAAEFNATPIMDGPYLVGVRLPSGAEFTLEMGGALEYSSTPLVGLAEAVQIARSDVERAARVAEPLGVALLSGGMLPFTPMTDVPWIPKPRVQIMRDFFATLGEDGSWSDGVMGLTLSAQTSFDYLSQVDLIEKLRVMVAAAPIISALFVNSPLENGADTRVLSRRMQFWQKIDPSRCGVLSFALRDGATAMDIVDWALNLPMIYRAKGGRHVLAPRRTFAELMRDGFGDGTWPIYSDWVSHLSQVWPQVRVRGTLEMRGPDGVAWPHFPASAAIWVGLVYNADVRRAVLDCLANLTAEQLRSATVDIAIKGLAASVGPHLVQDLARELLRLARRGLTARVDSGHEPRHVLNFLDPLDEVAETGRTFADQCLGRWENDFDRKPAAYVRAYQV